MQIGHYQLKDELGAGGMGTVYRGIDTRTDTTVAIKQLKKDITTPETIERFRREGEALRDLNHPNIVKMLDMFEHNGQHYLVLEYVSGGDLADLIKQGQLEVEQIVNMAIDLADALTRAHRLDIIHRDLKPENVMIGDDGVLRLTDFGIAHIGSKGRVTETGMAMGTIPYMPPEAFTDDVIDARYDIWAFGVMLFEMLAGEQPFDNNGLINNILTAPIPDLEALCPSASSALVDLVYRMLERNLNERIQSVRHIGAELEDIQQGRSNTPKLQRFETSSPSIWNLPKHNLPAPSTLFVGRLFDLNELAHLIHYENCRCITILAPGGMGKTQLALAFARQQVDNFSDGVYFVELASLSAVDNIVPAITEIFNYKFQSGRTQEQQMLDLLSNKHCLLIFDNFEHLLDGASIVTSIIQRAPQVQILVTSRERLNQSGETVYNLGAMDFPNLETQDDAMTYTAIELFMHTAKRLKPDFELTDDNFTHVVRICKLVQGMPLGIVLAASWIGLLTADEIATEIVQGLDFLETDMSDLPERHRSIRAVFDYSWKLMNPSQQNVFIRLSVFRGGFTREAAQIIAGADLRSLMHLMNQALIRRDSTTGRYYIHELLRQYAEEKLEIIGIAEDARYTHAQYFNQLMADGQAKYDDHRQMEIVEFIESNYANIRTSWLYLVESGHAIEIRGMASVYQEFVMRKSWYDDADYLFEKAIEALRKEPAGKERDITLGYLLALDAYMNWFIGDFAEGKRFAEEALDLLLPYDCYEKISRAYLSLAWMEYFHKNTDKALAAAKNGIEFAERTSRKDLLAWNLWMLAISLRLNGDLEGALAAAEKKIEISLAMGKLNRIGNAYSVKAEMLYATDHYEEAKSLYHQALTYHKRCKFNWGIATTLVYLTNVSIKLGQYQEAEGYILQAMQYRLRENNMSGLHWALLIWCQIATHLDQTYRIITVLSCVITNSQIEDHINKAQTLLESHQSSLSPDVFEQAKQQGKSTTIVKLVQQLLKSRQA